jgi:hypothetical protein
VDIGFKNVGANSERCAKSTERVLRVTLRKATMGKNSGRLAIKEAHNALLSILVLPASINGEAEATSV